MQVQDGLPPPPAPKDTTQSRGDTEARLAVSAGSSGQGSVGRDLAKNRVVLWIVAAAATVLVAGAIAAAYFLARSRPCKPNEIRGPGGSCVECYHSSHCASRVCDGSTNRCEDCVSGEDCREAGSATSFKTPGQCSSNVGSRRRCAVAQCTEDSECANGTDPRIRFCVEGACVECRASGDCPSPEGSDPACVNGACVVCDASNPCQPGFACGIGEGPHNEGLCARGCAGDGDCPDAKPACYRPSDPAVPSPGTSPSPGVCQRCDPLRPSDVGPNSPSPGCTSDAPYCVYPLVADTARTSEGYGCAQGRGTSDCAPGQVCSGGACAPVDTVGLAVSLQGHQGVSSGDATIPMTPSASRVPLGIAAEAANAPIRYRVTGMKQAGSQLRSSTLLMIPRSGGDGSGVFAITQQLEQNQVFSLPTVCGTGSVETSVLGEIGKCSALENLNAPIQTATFDPQGAPLRGVPLRGVVRSERATFMHLVYEAKDNTPVADAKAIQAAQTAGDPIKAYIATPVGADADSQPKTEDNQGTLHYLGWARFGTGTLGTPEENANQAFVSMGEWYLTLIGFENQENSATAADRMKAGFAGNRKQQAQIVTADKSALTVSRLDYYIPAWKLAASTGS